MIFIMQKNPIVMVQWPSSPSLSPVFRLAIRWRVTHNGVFSLWCSHFQATRPTVICFRIPNLKRNTIATRTRLDSTRLSVSFPFLSSLVVHTQHVKQSDFEQGPLGIVSELPLHYYPRHDCRSILKIMHGISGVQRATQQSSYFVSQHEFRTI